MEVLSESKIQAEHVGFKKEVEIIKNNNSTKNTKISNNTKTTENTEEKKIENDFEFQMSDAMAFKNILNCINALVEESDFTMSNDGTFSMREMSPDHICMVEVSMPKTAFDEVIPRESKVRFNIETILKILRYLKSDESLKFKTHNEVRELELIIKRKLEKFAKVPLLTPSGEEVPTPKIGFNSSFEVVLNTLDDIMKEMQNTSDHVNISTDYDTINFESSSELSSMKIPLTKDSVALLHINSKEDSKSTYNLIYLAGIIKTIKKVSETCNIEFSTKMPMKISTNIGESTITYYLAPRIEVE